MLSQKYCQRLNKTQPYTSIRVELWFSPISVLLCKYILLVIEGFKYTLNWLYREFLDTEKKCLL